MELKVCQVGNGWFLSLPREIAKSLGVSPGDRVAADVKKGQLIAEPIRHAGYRLEDLLSGITAKNLHQEVSTGWSVGQEAL